MFTGNIATGTLSFYNLTVPGSVTTSTNFAISSVLDVSGSFTASAGTATFTGTSILNGTANLFNVTLNGTSLQLSTNAVIGIAGLDPLPLIRKAPQTPQP